MNFHVIGPDLMEIAFILDMPSIPPVRSSIYAGREYVVEHIEITIPKKSMWSGLDSKARIDVLISYASDKKSRWKIK